MTGELALAVGVGLAIVVCGALAWWGAVRSFSRSDRGSGNRD